MFFRIYKKIMIYTSVFTFLQITSTPKVSIITSVYKGGYFIEEFMRDITNQTMFDQCELIIINANSPDNEEEVILRYMKKYPNIFYLRLGSDPGLYPVWNMAIKLSNAQYIMNANVDDRLKEDAMEVFVKALDENPEIDLVYSDIFITSVPNSPYDGCKAWAVSNFNAFSQKAMMVCMPMNHPMWRKTLHDKYGLFSEEYKAAGDYEMWLRAVDQGAHFLKINSIYGVWYYNPQGLSNNLVVHRKEVSEILKKYCHLFDLSYMSPSELYEKFLLESSNALVIVSQDLLKQAYNHKKAITEKVPLYYVGK